MLMKESEEVGLPDGRKNLCASRIRRYATCRSEDVAGRKRKMPLITLAPKTLSAETASCDTDTEVQFASIACPTINGT